MQLQSLFSIPTTFGPLAFAFVVCAALVLLFALKLSKYCDALEKKTHISALLIGAVFLAIVTSMPEFVAAVGSVLIEAVDLGVGNLFGSNTLNLLIIVVLDVFYRRGDLHMELQPNIMKVAASGVVLMVLAAGAILLHIGVSDGSQLVAGVVCSVAIFGIYIRRSLTSTQESPEAVAVSKAGQQNTYSYTLSRIVVGLVGYSAVLVVAAWFLLQVCDQLAVTPIPLGSREIILGQTLTGTFLLALATSLPEVSVSFNALRLGQTNMAVANVLGSNMVNMSFLPVMHLFSGKKDFYALVNVQHLIVIGVALLMSFIFMVGLRVHARRDFLRIGWESWCMLAVYLVGMVIIVGTGLQQ